MRRDVGKAGDVHSKLCAVVAPKEMGIRRWSAGIRTRARWAHRRRRNRQSAL